MSNIETHVLPDAERAKFAAAGYLNELLANHQNVPVLLLISGGSSLAVLDHVHLFNFENVTVMQVDERITGSVQDQNAHAFGESEFGEISQGITFIPIEQSEKPEASAAKYEKVLKDWVKNHPDAFVVAILGMGPDGHTAGEMPGFDNLFRGPQWVVGYDAGSASKFPNRVTVTRTFLTEVVTEAVLYFTGEEKKKAFEQIHNLPAGVIFDIKKVAIFTDQNVDVRL